MPMNILAVDDSAMARELLARMFAATEFPPIRLACDATEALALLRDPASGVNCILLDVDMPGTCGITLCRQIRALPHHRETPVIIVTARTDRATIDAAFAAGANDYIGKIFDVKAFAARVKIAERLLERGDAVHLPPLDAVGSTDAPTPGMPEDIAGTHGFAFGDALMLHGVARMVLPFSLGNYLARQPSSALSEGKVFAVHLETIAAHFAQETTRSLTQILTHVAEAIVAAAGETGLLLAYMGRGHFMCVAPEGPLAPVAVLEEAIAGHLRAVAGTMAGTGQAPALERVRVSVGSAAAPTLIKGRRVRGSFERALSRLRPARETGAMGMTGAGIIGEGLSASAMGARRQARAPARMDR